MTSATIVYVTSRKNPHFAWFLDSLCRQASFDQRRHLQLIVVDGCLWHEDMRTAVKCDDKIAFASPVFHDAARRLELETIVNNRIECLHIPPLPNVWSGPFRKTQKNWFAASVSRNTGFVTARHSYVGFVDDLSILGPLWLANLLHAAHNGYCVAGAYKKLLDMKVEGGELISFKDFPAGVDSRWEHGSDAGIVPWAGSIFGCSFGVPLEAALAIDGFDMAHNGSGNEDSDFSIRLRRSGREIFYNRNMVTFESEEDHHNQTFKDQATRDRRKVLKKNLPAAYESYQMPSREERHFSDHVLINRVVNEPRIAPLLPQYLRNIRQMYLETKGLVEIPSEPTRDWRDDEPLDQL